MLPAAFWTHLPNLCHFDRWGRTRWSISSTKHSQILISNPASSVTSDIATVTMTSATAAPVLKPSSRPTPAPSSPSLWAIPPPLQKLFNHFPLVTLDPNPLPARSQVLTSASDTHPTLYVFSSDVDALEGKPSINPTCLKWQTLLRLNHLPFLTLPSSNHASPTGALPFLLPPRNLSSNPIPSASIPAYISRFTSTKPPIPTPREEAYLSLLNPLRLAFLYTLYLTPEHSPLLQKFYISPSTSSPLLGTVLQSQLSAAASAAVLQSLGLHPQTGTGGIDGEELYAEAAEALESLATLLKESPTGWFFGRERPEEFDAGLYGYVGIIMEYMDNTPGGRLGQLVRNAGEGVLVVWWEQIKKEAWGGGVGERGEMMRSEEEKYDYIIQCVRN
ncbi:hypothetical protein QBC36DRAFT_21833 [Triangularia setosa]|uniref:Thioredoxin-like fold domain-containing protein n=1 Tax=Triangularia setosa TaxID=2587417 RepID=A0AAN6W602_9PEZI|nr:hypothetical protein QBC36DRAFT_21833 [Podospora setosa]